MFLLPHAHLVQLYILCILNNGKNKVIWLFFYKDNWFIRMDSFCIHNWDFISVPHRMNTAITKPVLCWVYIDPYGTAQMAYVNILYTSGLNSSLQYIYIISEICFSGARQPIYYHLTFIHTYNCLLALEAVCILWRRRHIRLWRHMM